MALERSRVGGSISKLIAVLGVAAIAAVAIFMRSSSKEEPHDRAGAAATGVAPIAAARAEPAPTTGTRATAVAETVPVGAAAPVPAHAAHSYPANSGALMPAARTFLTGNPDSIGFLDEIRLLGTRAAVVPESIQRDPDGTTKGEVVLSEVHSEHVGHRYSVSSTP
jgi:hypothetical protein